MKTRSLALILTIFIGLITFFFLYRHFSEKSETVLPEKLHEIQKVLAQHHFNLVKNRVDLISFTKLDPNSSDFKDKKSSLLQSMLKTNEEGLKALEDPYHPTYVNSNPEDSGSTNFINNELNPVIPKLLSENKRIN